MIERLEKKRLVEWRGGLERRKGSWMERTPIRKERFVEWNGSLRRRKGLWSGEEVSDEGKICGLVEKRPLKKGKKIVKWNGGH